MLSHSSAAVSPTSFTPVFLCHQSAVRGLPLRTLRKGEAVQELLQALCLVLILEGIMPFLYPRRWRQMAITLATTSDKKLRLLGLMSMLIGLGSLYLMR